MNSAQAKQVARSKGLVRVDYPMGWAMVPVSELWNSAVMYRARLGVANCRYGSTDRYGIETLLCQAELVNRLDACASMDEAKSILGGKDPGFDEGVEAIVRCIKRIQAKAA